MELKRVYLYKISQNVNRSYDTYDSAVVAATSEEEARRIEPSEYSRYSGNAWTTPEHVKVELIGTALKTVKSGSVICASFNAG